MGAAPAERALDRPMFVFTDESGAVVLIEDDLARVVGLESPEEAIGDPLAAVLGLSSGDAEKMLGEIGTTGTARHRLAEIRNRRTGRRMWVLLGGSTPSAAAGFLGADIMVSPVTLAPPAEDLDHRHNLERMAEMVRRRMRNGGGPVISEEKEIELRSYFAARMLALYVLIVRMGGRAVGESFEGRIRLVSRELGSAVDMNRGRLTLGVADLSPEVLSQISQVALTHAAQVTSRRLVTRELAELDVNFTPATIQRAAHYGLRGDL
jgi:hypothetical protein